MVTVISRLESKSAFDPTVPVIKTDYTLPSLTSAFHGQDAIISCLPMRAIQQEIVCIDAAIAAGVKWFVPSEWGCPTTPEMVELLPILGVKQKSVEYLRKKEKEGLNWTAVCPGLFLDWVRFFPLSFPTRVHETSGERKNGKGEYELIKK
jgi:hypothetical protein